MAEGAGAGMNSELRSGRVRAGGHPGPGVGLPRSDRQALRRRGDPVPGEPGARRPELARRGPAGRGGENGGGRRAAAGSGRPAGLQAADGRPGHPLRLRPGDRVWLGGPMPAGTDAHRIPLDFAEIDCRPGVGDELRLRDGRIRLAVVRTAGEGCLCAVAAGGEAVGRMGVALAGEAGVRVSRLLPRELLERCLRGGVRAFLLSYCEEAADPAEVAEVCRALGVEGVRLIPKIETLRALDNLPAILGGRNRLRRPRRPGHPGAPAGAAGGGAPPAGGGAGGGPPRLDGRGGAGRVRAGGVRQPGGAGRGVVRPGSRGGRLHPVGRDGGRAGSRRRRPAAERICTEGLVNRQSATH